jgi:MFS family permease
VQLAAANAIRGRVMGVYLLVFIGSGAVGGPLLGYLDQHLGPRAGMLLAGLAPAIVLACVNASHARPARAFVDNRIYPTGSSSCHGKAA